jgi:hypothetical protein
MVKNVGVGGNVPVGRGVNVAVGSGVLVIVQVGDGNTVPLVGEALGKDTAATDVGGGKGFNPDWGLLYIIRHAPATHTIPTRTRIVRIFHNRAGRLLFSKGISSKSGVSIKLFSISWKAPLSH